MNIIGIDTRMTGSGKQYPWRLLLSISGETKAYKMALPASETWLNRPYDRLYGNLLEGRPSEHVADELRGLLDRDEVFVMARHAELPVLKGLNLRAITCLVEDEDGAYEAEAEIQAITRQTQTEDFEP